MADSTNSHAVCIKQWKAAYYVNKDKKWRYGQLGLIPEGVVFTEASTGTSSNTDTTGFSQTILFSSFTDVKKTTSTMIFPVITISTNSDRHWFGSFTDRQSVFNTVAHFWRMRLIPENKSPRAAGGTRTKLGRELLRLAHDSQATMSSAARTLHHQGQQIDSSLATMDDLHNDLDVADKFVSELESWLGNWRASANVPLTQSVLIKHTDLPDIANFEVLYAKAVGTSLSGFVPGSVWISRKEGVTILGTKQDIIQHFGPGGVCLSRVRVLNPWELILTSYRLGESDLSYHLLSTKAVEALRHLEVGRADKIEYMRPSPVYVWVDSTITTGRASLLPRQELSAPSMPASGVVQPNTTAQTQSQLLQKHAPVSDQEVQELSDILSDLKGMAIAVQQEEDKQLEALDTLLMAVDMADARRAELENRVQKLIKN
ncbi:synaptosomal-associated protein 47-like [Liolophura sinensis]|uniref:synaptosomal-associated protein 47-like n=1 Tax=Liolophura sinensis TaxID=3198878 RepID=UPI0031593CD7